MTPLSRAQLVSTSTWFRYSTRKFSIALLAGFFALCLNHQPAFSKVPHDMAYQGKLSDAAGAPLSGYVDLQLLIFGAPVAESPLYAEDHIGVELDENGTFSVRLGAGQPWVGQFDEKLFSGMNRYLEIVVDDEVLSPRQPLGSVPWALMANDVVIDDSTQVGAAIGSAQATADSALAGVIAIQEIVKAGWATPETPPAPQHAATADHATDAEHATTADQASYADYAAKAGHATSADHATTADHATVADRAIKADHAAVADYAHAAATAAHALRADTAATADTLSASLCSEGQILWKGPTGWQCIDLPSAAVPIFAMGRAATAYSSVLYAIGETAPYSTTLDDFDVILPRDGFLSDLVVSPRDLANLNGYSHPPVAGTVLVTTVVVNESETTLSVTHSFDSDGMNFVSNNSDRVPVRAGDRIVVKFEETGGVCMNSFNPQTGGTCGAYRAAFLLE